MEVVREGNTSCVYISPSSSGVTHTAAASDKRLHLQPDADEQQVPVSPGGPPIPSVPLTSSRYNLAVTAQAGVCEADGGWDRL